MARIRSIKPEFFLDEDLAKLPALTRLLFIGLWNHADRDGRLEDRPARIKVTVLPYDDADVDAMLAALHEHEQRFITRYEINGARYIAIRSFAKHQKPHVKEPASTIPAPAGPGEHRASPGKTGPGRGSAESALEAGPGKTGPNTVEHLPGRLEVEALVVMGVEVEALPAGQSPAGPNPPPPPLAPLSDQDQAALAALTGKAQRAAARSPSEAVGRLAARARETIIPRGAAPLAPDAGEVAAWEAILARDADPWWVERMCELLGQVAKSEKHGPGGSFTISSPQQLLKKSAPRDPQSKPILDEMLSKFPTRLETPEKRAKRERGVFVEERTRELEVEAIQRLGRTRLKTDEERAIRQQVEREWAERQAVGIRAGPAPPQVCPDSSTVSTSSTEESS